VLWLKRSALFFEESIAEIREKSPKLQSLARKMHIAPPNIGLTNERPPFLPDAEEDIGGGTNHSHKRPYDVHDWFCSVQIRKLVYPQAEKERSHHILEGKWKRF